MPGPTSGPCLAHSGTRARPAVAPACPGTFAAAMAHPVWGVCIRAAARSLRPVHWPDTRRHPASAPPPIPHPPHAHLHSRVPAASPHAVDLKRAAANDRDD